MLKTHRTRQVGLRDDTQMRQQQVAFQVVAALARKEAEGNPAVVRLRGAEVPRSMVTWDSRRANATDQAKALDQRHGSGHRLRQPRHGAQKIGAGFDQRQWRRSGGDHLCRDEIQKRSGASKDGGLRNHPGLFHQDLCGARRHDAGQGPAGKRYRTFLRAGRDQNVRGRGDMAVAVAGPDHTAIRIDAPNRCAGLMRNIRMIKAANQISTAGIFRTQPVPPGRCRDVAIDLPARAALLIQKLDLHATLCRDTGCSHACRTSADNDQIRAHGRSPIRRAPSWR